MDRRMDNSAEDDTKVLYVGNLPFKTSPDEIKSAFTEYGAVHSIKLIREQLTGRFRGFAFIKMDCDGACLALEAMNYNEFGGRQIRIEEAMDQVGPVTKRAPKKIGAKGK